MNELIALAIQTWLDTVKQRILDEWETNSKITDMQKSIDTVVMPFANSLVSGKLSAMGYGAFISEYGSGHLIDTNSPYWEDYVESDAYNPARASDGNEFIGRADGDVIYRPDGTQDVSMGRAEGKRLEHQLGNLAPYEAVPPSHKIQEVIDLALPELILSIESIIRKTIEFQITGQTINIGG